MNRVKEKWALWFGSIIGAFQMAIGLSIGVNHGMLAAFIASTILYVVASKLYLWATDPGEPDDQAE